MQRSQKKARGNIVKEDRRMNKNTKPPSKEPGFVIRPEFKYEKHILAMQTIEGFYNEWTTRLGYYTNYEEAYEATETFFQMYFDRRRFKDYDSFRSSLRSWLKK